MMPWSAHCSWPLVNIAAPLGAKPVCDSCFHSFRPPSAPLRRGTAAAAGLPATAAAVPDAAPAPPADAPAALGHDDIKTALCRVVDDLSAPLAAPLLGACSGLRDYFCGHMRTARAREDADAIGLRLLQPASCES